MAWFPTYFSMSNTHIDSIQIVSWKIYLKYYGTVLVLNIDEMWWKLGVSVMPWFIFTEELPQTMLMMRRTLVLRGHHWQHYFPIFPLTRHPLYTHDDDHQDDHHHHHHDCEEHNHISLHISPADTHHNHNYHTFEYFLLYFWIFSFHNVEYFLWYFWISRLPV